MKKIFISGIIAGFTLLSILFNRLVFSLLVIPRDDQRILQPGI